MELLRNMLRKLYFGLMDQLPLVISSSLAFSLYLNTLNAEFVYDDGRAIITNQDLRPETPWLRLLTDDFWGTPLRHSGSHKSYRPLTVATFRLNYHFDALNPFGYHLVNVLLHTIVTGLVVSVTTRLSGSPVIIWTSGLLFASHPIHTEAVAGVVGRADLLTTLCFVLCMHSYLTWMDWDSMSVCQLDPSRNSLVKSLLNILLFFVSATGAVLAKEHGLTILGVCFVYDLILTSSAVPVSESASTLSSPGHRRNHRLVSFDRKFHGQRSKQSSPVNKQQQNGPPLSVFNFPRLLTGDVPNWIATRCRTLKERATYKTYIRWSLVFAIGLLLAFGRLWLMGFSAPTFSPSDNPAAHSDHFFTRLMTFSYLIAFSAMLLLCPSTLSFDWSMDSIPLLDRLSDSRNLGTVSVFLGIAILSFCILKRVTSSHGRTPGVISAVSSPRSVPITDNIFKPVDVNGNACSLDDFAFWWTGRISPNTAKAFQCTVQNCSSGPCFQSGAKGPRTTSAQMDHSQCDHHSAGVSSYKLKFRGRHLDSLKPLDIAASDSDLGLDHNELCDDRTALLGLLIVLISFVPASNVFFYVGFVVAERLLYLPSVGYCFLIGVGINNLWRLVQKSRIRSVLFYWCCFAAFFALCSKTIIRNGDWQNEELLYSSGVTVNPAKSYSNLGNVYAQKRMTDEAVRAYRAALSYRPNMADTHYNYGILLQEKGDHKAAALAYENAIKCRPRMALAHLNMGIVLTAMQKHKEAEKRYQTCSELSGEGLKDPKSHESAKLSCLYNLGRLYADRQRYSEAISAYRLAVQRLHPYYQAHSLYNALGDALSKSDQFHEAEVFFKKSLATKADHVPAHLTYGHLLAKMKRRQEAVWYFERAASLSPLDSTVWQHLGQFHFDNGDFEKAVGAYKQAWILDENDFGAVFGLANAYRNSGNTMLAEVYYEKAVALRPETANARMNFGAILHINKKWKRAEREYQLALEISPNDELIKENLRKLRKAMSKTKENSIS